MRFDSLDAAVRACLAVRDQTWDLACLKADPLFRLFSAKQVSEIISLARACGADEAAALKGERCADPLKLAEKFGIQIERCGPERFNNPYVVNFAQVRGNRVLLSEFMIGEVERALERLECRPALGEFSVPGLMAAHELYHCIEERKRSIETTTMKIPVKQAKVLIRKVTPLAASEIGAFAFAKGLLSLTFHPRLVEVIGMWETQPEAAERFVERLCSLDSIGMT